MGDFNFPDIDCVDEACLTQHAQQATRKNVVFDLVLRSEPDVTNRVSVLGSLDTSDHEIFEWIVQLSP